MRADRAGEVGPGRLTPSPGDSPSPSSMTPTSGRGEDPIRVEQGLSPGPYYVGQEVEFTLRVEAEGERPSVAPFRVAGADVAAIDAGPAAPGRSRPTTTTGARCPSIRVPDRPEAYRDARHPAGGRAAGDALGLEPAGPILGPTPAERGTAQGLPRRRRPVPGRGRGEPSSRPGRRRVRVPPAHHRARRARLPGRARPHALRSRAARPPDHPPPRSRSRPIPPRGSIATGSGRPGRARPSCRR